MKSIINVLAVVAMLLTVMYLGTTCPAEKTDRPTSVRITYLSGEVEVIDNVTQYSASTNHYMIHQVGWTTIMINANVVKRVEWVK